MSIFDVLSLIGGLCLFLFGMNVMGPPFSSKDRAVSAAPSVLYIKQ